MALQPSPAADDSVCFLWATVPDACLMRWCSWRTGTSNSSHSAFGLRISVGTGHWFRNKHEILLVGTRGKVPAPVARNAIRERDHRARGRAQRQARDFPRDDRALFPDPAEARTIRAGAGRAGLVRLGKEAEQ